MRRFSVPETYTLIAEQFTVVWECLCVHQFHFPRSLDLLHDSPSLKPLKIFTSSCDWLTNDNDFFFQTALILFLYLARDADTEMWSERATIKRREAREKKEGKRIRRLILFNYHYILHHSPVNGSAADGACRPIATPWVFFWMKSTTWSKNIWLRSLRSRNWCAAIHGSSTRRPKTTEWLRW